MLRFLNKITNLFMSFNKDGRYIKINCKLNLMF